MADSAKAQALAGIKARSIKKYGAGKMQSAKNLNATYERTHARGGIGKTATGKPGKGAQASGSATQRKRPPGPNTIRPKGKGYGTNPVRRTTMVREQNSRVPGGMELTRRPSASAASEGPRSTAPARDINGNLKKVGAKRTNPVSRRASANAATRPPGVSKAGASKPGGPIYREPPLRPKAKAAPVPQRPAVSTRPMQRPTPKALPGRPVGRIVSDPTAAMRQVRQPQTSVNISFSHGPLSPGAARKPAASKPVVGKSQ